MTVRTAIVPVAGLGTRLLPITAATPKELLPLGGKPVLHYIAEELGRVGVQKIILVSSHQKQQIARYFQLNQALVDSLRESVAVDPALGPVGALLAPTARAHRDRGPRE